MKNDLGQGLDPIRAAVKRHSQSGPRRGKRSTAGRRKKKGKKEYVRDSHGKGGPRAIACAKVGLLKKKAESLSRRRRGQFYIRHVGRKGRHSEKEGGNQGKEGGKKEHRRRGCRAYNTALPGSPGQGERRSCGGYVAGTQEKKKTRRGWC